MLGVFVVLSLFDLDVLIYTARGGGGGGGDVKVGSVFVDLVSRFVSCVVPRALRDPGRGR